MKSIWTVNKLPSAIGIAAELYWLHATWWNELFILLLNEKFMIYLCIDSITLILVADKSLYTKRQVEELLDTA